MFSVDYGVLDIMANAIKEIPEGVRMLGAPLEWPETKGKGIKVAVLDTGCPQHPDIKVTDAWASDNLSNANKGDVFDRNGHSSHVCGIIAANGQIKGVAPEVELYTAKVLDDTGSGNDASLANGIYWAISKGVHVINMSLGGISPQTMLHGAIKFAVEQGIIVICASGNSGLDWMAYPARFDETIAVASIDKFEQWSDFSSVGAEVELVALGTEVFSTYLNGQYAILSGTSMATPHISGAVALLQAKAKLRFGRTLNTEEMRIALNLHAKDIGVPGRDEKYGFGLFTFGTFGDIEKIQNPTINIDMTIGEKTFLRNGQPVTLDVAPFVQNNRTFLPLRGIAEALYCQVDWTEAEPDKVYIRGW